MANVPNVPRLYKMLDQAEEWTAAAAASMDPEERAALAAVAQAMSTLALAHATWLAGNRP